MRVSSPELTKLPKPKINKNIEIERALKNERELLGKGELERETEIREEGERDIRGEGARERDRDQGRVSACQIH